MTIREYVIAVREHKAVFVDVKEGMTGDEDTEIFGGALSCRAHRYQSWRRNQTGADN